MRRLLARNKKQDASPSKDLISFARRYRHIGISYPGVSHGWIPIVKNAIVLIEQKMWPRWIPLPLRWLIHWLATGNSVVRVKYWWAYRLRQHLTQGQIISCIKDKFAGLRIYGAYRDEIEAIINAAAKECSATCEFCGSKPAEIVGQGWIYNACSICATKRQLKEHQK